jgi:hypothetical protein
MVGMVQGRFGLRQQCGVVDSGQDSADAIGGLEEKVIAHI